MPPDPGSHSHPSRGLPQGTGAAGLALLQITLFPCRLLPISVVAAGRHDRTPNAPCWGAVRKGSQPPSPGTQPRGSLFLHELFSFRLDAVLHGGKSRTGAPAPHILATKQQSGG